MTEIGFGIPTMFTSGPIDVPTIRRMVRLAEDGGLTQLAVGDHLNWYSGTLEAMTVLGFLAGETRLDLTANVIVLPLRHPFPLAKQAATIAGLASGEFTLGVGVGGEHATEFQAIGVDTAERRPRMEESLRILTALLSGEPVDYHGTYVSSTAAALDPAVRVPVLLGGRGPAALRRAATLGDGWSSAWVRPEQYERRMAVITERLVALGRPVEEFRFVAHARIAFGPDPERAWESAKEYLGSHYGTTDVGPFQRQTICGTARDVAAELIRYLDVGVGRIIVTFASMDHTRDLERFCDEVMPLLP